MVHVDTLIISIHIQDKGLFLPQSMPIRVPLEANQTDGKILFKASSGSLVQILRKALNVHLGSSGKLKITTTLLCSTR